MVSALVSGSSGPGSSPGRGHCGQDTLLSQCLSPPRCVNGYRPIKCWGIPLMDLQPIQGRIEIPLVASCYRNRDKFWPGGPLGSYADFTFTAVRCTVPIVGLHQH